jgi:hypothetical protein
MQQRGAGPDGTDKSLTTQPDFEAAVRGCIDEAFADDEDEKAAVKAAVGTTAFTNAMKASYKRGDEPASPWEMTGGGHEHDSKKVLFGGDPESKPLCDAPMKGLPADMKATNLLSKVVGAFNGRTDKTVTVSVEGKHGMRAVPTHPSLDKLKNGPKSVAENVEEHLVKAGEKIATKDPPVPKEKAEFLCAKAVDAFLADHLKKPERVKAARENKPAGPMKPADLKEHLLKNFQPEIDKITREVTEAVNAEIEKRSKTSKPMTTVEADKMKADLTKTKMATLDPVFNAIDTFLLKEFDFPEFVVADTNWGSAQGKTFHVIAPDPSTGKPAMWKKEEPAGTFTREKEEWLDAEWKYVE